MGLVIRTIHLLIPFLALSAVIHGLHVAALTQIVLAYMALLAFILFDGCILSMIEHELCDDGILVIDPFLEFAGYDPNGQNRKSGTLYGYGIYLVSITLIYLKRFWF
jgi:hypothetical protein